MAPQPMAIPNGACHQSGGRYWPANGEGPGCLATVWLRHFAAEGRHGTQAYGAWPISSLITGAARTAAAAPKFNPWHDRYD
jgi:hypothetical protein